MKLAILSSLALLVATHANPCVRISGDTNNCCKANPISETEIAHEEEHSTKNGMYVLSHDTFLGHSRRAGAFINPRNSNIDFYPISDGVFNYQWIQTINNENTVSNRNIVKQGVKFFKSFDGLETFYTRQLGYFSESELHRAALRHYFTRLYSKGCYQIDEKELTTFCLCIAYGLAYTYEVQDDFYDNYKDNFNPNYVSALTDAFANDTQEAYDKIFDDYGADVVTKVNAGGCYISGFSIKSRNKYFEQEDFHINWSDDFLNQYYTVVSEASHFPDATVLDTGSSSMRGGAATFKYGTDDAGILRNFQENPAVLDDEGTPIYEFLPTALDNETNKNKLKAAYDVYMAKAVEKVNEEAKSFIKVPSYVNQSFLGTEPGVKFKFGSYWNTTTKFEYEVDLNDNELVLDPRSAMASGMVVIRVMPSFTVNQRRQDTSVYGTLYIGDKSFECCPSGFMGGKATYEANYDRMAAQLNDLNGNFKVRLVLETNKKTGLWIFGEKAATVQDLKLDIRYEASSF